MNGSRNGVRQALLDVGLLVLRVTLGVTFVIHGWGKLHGGEGGSLDLSLTGFTTSLTNLGVPYPKVSAWLATAAEFGGGLLLIIGLLPRIAAFGIGFTMVVAIVEVHGSNGFLMKNQGYEYCLNLLAMSVLIMLAGGGRFGLQPLVMSIFTRKRREPLDFLPEN